YGDDATSFLHQNGTDRFWVTWSIASRRVEDRIAGLTQLPSLDTFTTILAVGPDGGPILHASAATPAGSALIEIPSDFNAFETKGSQFAFEWRQAVRQALTAAIDAGYTVTNFVRGNGKGTYVLT